MREIFEGRWMVSDTDEFRKLIIDKNISSVDEMEEESKKFVMERVPNFKEKYNEGIIMRGKIIEASILLEIAFDELITKTGGEDLVMDAKKKEFYLITGAKKENELGGLGFKNKIEILKKILMMGERECVHREYLQSEEWKKKDKDFIDHFKECKECGGKEGLGSYHISYKNFGKESDSDVVVLCWFHQIGKRLVNLESLDVPEPPLLVDLEKISVIRDIFAHVAINWLSKDLEFNNSSLYTKHLFKLNPKWKNVSVSFAEFMSLQKEVLELIPVYIKSVLLKRELFSQIFLGDNYQNFLKKAKEGVDALDNKENQDKGK